MKTSFRRLLFCVALLFSTLAASPAGIWIEAASTNLGNGSFQYRIGSRSVPMIKDTLLGGFHLPFTNAVEIASSPIGWTNLPGATSQAWQATNQGSFWQEVPYDALFELKSSLTNCTVADAFVTMSLAMYEFWTPPGASNVYSVNIVGYWIAPVLVPCSEAGGPPAGSAIYTNLSMGVFEIDELLHTNGVISGIRFAADRTSTFQLEASENMDAWTAVSYLYGYAGTTTWLSGDDMKQWGRFFRLSYVGEGEIPFTNLPHLGALQAARIATVLPRPLHSVVRGDSRHLTIQLHSKAGRTYQVELTERGNRLWQRHYVADSDTLTFALPTSELPRSGLIISRELR